jgi:hypothetical protein
VSLPGPSRTITVEPVERPAQAPAPAEPAPVTAPAPPPPPVEDPVPA